MSHPLHDDIEVRAYRRWEDRGRPWGTPEVDWFHAEYELTEESKDHPLGELAKQVGGILGTAVAFVSGKVDRHDLHSN